MLDYKLYIFDWDGTLMDTIPTIVAATKYACAKLDLPMISDADALSIIGQSFVLVIADVVPELRKNPELLQKFTAIYETYLNEHCLDNPLFANAYEILEQLTAAGKTLTVATGRNRVMLDDILRHTGYGKYFLLTKTACECQSKPHPQMIEEILEFTGIDKSQAVMIGDTSHDIHMAHNAGVASIAISHGAQTYDEIMAAAPDYIVADLYQLQQLLS